VQILRIHILHNPQRMKLFGLRHCLSTTTDTSCSEACLSQQAFMQHRVAVTTSSLPMVSHWRFPYAQAKAASQHMSIMHPRKAPSSSSSYTSPARSLCRSNKCTLVPKEHHQANLGGLCSFPEPVPDVAASQHVQGMGEQLKTAAKHPHTKICETLDVQIANLRPNHAISTLKWFFHITTVRHPSLCVMDMTWRMHRATVQVGKRQPAHVMIVLPRPTNHPQYPCINTLHTHLRPTTPPAL
jgi:hypothetical protein